MAQILSLGALPWNMGSLIYTTNQGSLHSMTNKRLHSKPISTGKLAKKIYRSRRLRVLKQRAIGWQARKQIKQIEMDKARARDKWLNGDTYKWEKEWQGKIV